MHIKRGIRTGLTVLFIILNVILVISCGGSFTVTFVDTLRPPVKEPEKQKPPEPVEKTKPPEPVQEPEIKIEEPEPKIVVSEEDTTSTAGEEQAESPEEKQPATEEESKEKTAQEPAVTEKQKEKKEQEQKVEPVKEKEKEKQNTTDNEKKTKPPEAKKEDVTITGIVSLRKNIFYITDTEHKKRYKLVGLKKEDEVLLKKFIGKQVDLELRIVSTEAKKAYNAQLVKLLSEVPDKEDGEEEPLKKDKKKK